MNIELSTETCQRLKGIMRPDETYELVIRRLLDSGTQAGPKPEWTSGLVTSNGPDRRGKSPAARSLSPTGLTRFSYTEEDKSNARRFGKDDYVPLSHTKIFEATINGKDPEKYNWDALIKLLLQEAEQRGAAIVEGLHPKLRMAGLDKLDQGYKPNYDFGVSIQGVSADNAARIIMDLADEYGVSVEIFFGWRDKKGAMYPGEFGLISINVAE